MKCPKCGHTFIHSDSYSTIQDSNSYIDYMSAYCPLCRKWFEWKEIFTLSEITPPEEMKENDHL
jgi:endogenous inhibitor of DNA gyrase (YacG/DUF329 family)